MARETAKDRELRTVRRALLEEQTRNARAKLEIRFLVDDLCGSKLPFEAYEDTKKRLERALEHLADPRPLEKSTT